MILISIISCIYIYTYIYTYYIWPMHGKLSIKWKIWIVIDKTHSSNYITILFIILRQIPKLPPSRTRHFQVYFLNENIWISIKISGKFVPEGTINNTPELVQIMARRRPGDKPLFEKMMVTLLTHICVTWHQWVICLMVCQSWLTRHP